MGAERQGLVKPTAQAAKDSPVGMQQQRWEGWGRSVEPALDAIVKPPKPEFRGVSQELRAARSGVVVMPKLVIGAPGDAYEQEADRVAAQVVQRLHKPDGERSQSEPSVQRKILPNAKDDLQRAPTGRGGEEIGGGEASPGLVSAITSARGSGQPLATELQQAMGQAMGADFSGVRVHTDTQADQLNRSMQAQAFTTGQDVFFRQGTYAPGNREGQELIAHELTHVVQQHGDGMLRSRTTGQSEAGTKIQRLVTKTGTKQEPAEKIYKNYLKGDPPFKPKHGTFGEVSWFAGTEPGAYIGGQAKGYTVEIEVEMPQPTRLSDTWFSGVLATWDPGGKKQNDKEQHSDFWKTLGKSLEGQGLAEVKIDKGPLSQQGAGTFITADISARPLVKLHNPAALREKVDPEGRIAEAVSKSGEGKAVSFTVVIEWLGTKQLQPAEKKGIEGTMAWLAEHVGSGSVATVDHSFRQTPSQKKNTKAKPANRTAVITLTFASYRDARLGAKKISACAIPDPEGLPTTWTWQIKKGDKWKDTAVKSYTEK